MIENKTSVERILSFVVFFPPYKHVQESNKHLVLPVKSLKIFLHIESIQVVIKTRHIQLLVFIL